MDLLFVRHARPVRHEPREGAADPLLHEEGREQARRLGRWLATEAIDAILVSPARRALETAAPLAGELDLDLVVDEGLSEFDREAASYVPVEELQAANDERWLALARGELYEESVDPVAFRRRVVDAVEEVVRARPGQTVVAVCHAGVINAYIGHILKIPTPLWFAPRYTSISRVAASRRGHRSVISLNETGHLRDWPV